MTKFAEHSLRSAGQNPPHEAADIAIRPASGSDLRGLAAIAAEREGDPLERWVESFRRLLVEGDVGRALVLVAEVHGRLVGFGKVARFTKPDDAPPNGAPSGWYLAGVVVSPMWRRRGIGSRLTGARLAWIAERETKAYYFANARNQVSIDMHRGFGFLELSRDFHHPTMAFEGGSGILFVCDLPHDSRG